MIKIIKNYNLEEVSYIHVGGICHKFIKTDEINYLTKIKKPFIAISNCSKILFAFDYSSLTFVQFNLSKVVFFKDNYFVFAGTSLNYLSCKLMEREIEGFEYLSTIPGLIGGSIVNNASFLKQCISDNLIEILALDDGNIRFINKKEIEFSYRYSNLKKNNFIIIGARFKSIHCNKKELTERLQFAINYRKNHQNLFINTLGSTFKNLPGLIIGKTIDELGLKGFYLDKKVRISNTHGNFLYIEPKANYLKVYHLIMIIKCVLYNCLGKQVNTEIVIIDQDGKYKS